MKTFWQVYSVFFAAVVLGILFTTVSDPNTTKWTYIDIVVSLPSVLALFGWAWERKYLHQYIWLVYAPIFLVLDAIYNLFLDKGNKASWMDAVAGLVLVGPSYVATVLYAIKFNKIKR